MIYLCVNSLIITYQRMYLCINLSKHLLSHFNMYPYPALLHNAPKLEKSCNNKYFSRWLQDNLKGWNDKFNVTQLRLNIFFQKVRFHPLKFEVNNCNFQIVCIFLSIFLTTMTCVLLLIILNDDTNKIIDTIFFKFDKWLFRPNARTFCIWVTLHI